METRAKNTLIIGTGLPGVGKTTHLKALSHELANSVYLDKDVICLALLQGNPYFSDYYNKYARNQSYEVMLQLAKDNLSQGKSVILDGYFGDKLTSLLTDYLDSPNFDTKVIYFHCTGQTQLSRLIERADVRDIEKIPEEKFVAHRTDHIKKHLTELMSVPHLIIDTEQKSELSNNICNIKRYLDLPNQIPHRTMRSALPIFSYEEIMSGAIGFKNLLSKISDDKKFQDKKSEYNEKKYSWSRFSIFTCIATAGLYVGCKLFSNQNTIKP